jgi:hypothetical protein
MGQLPRSPAHRQATINRSFLGGSVGGRSSIPSPEPRPLPAIGAEPPGGELVAAFGTTGLWTDLPASSGPFPARNSGIIFEVTFGCNVVASDDTVIEIFNNGVSLGTWTLPAGEGAGPAYTAAFDGGTVAVNDIMRIDHVSGGTDLEDPTILIAALSDTGSRGSPGAPGTNGADGLLASVVAGVGIEVDSTDPANPIVSATGMALIAEASPTGSSVDFTSIPSTFRHLVLEFCGRGAAAVTTVFVSVRFNNDSAANYDDHYTGGNDATALNGDDTAQTEGFVFNIPGASAESGRAGIGTLKIPHYANTSFHKTALAHMAAEFDATSNFDTISQAITWKSTAAINRITVKTDAGNFVAGTLVSLYGLL